MALDPKARAALALHRFGFGPKAGSIAATASDPQGALVADLDRPNAGQIADPSLLTTGEAARTAFDFRRERRAARLVQNAERDAASAGAAAKNSAGKEMQADTASEQMQPAPPQPNIGANIPQQILLEEAKARTDAALGCDIGFAERWVWFWSNHFCVSADKGTVRALVGAYEREAIRAHAFGRFADMLAAVETHPAMLIYLDNARSIGPNSPAGIKQGKGLNENLAREILELHTVGVRTVYNQDDVTSFAKVITGWTIVPLKEDRGGEFIFNPRMHEPGAQRVVGQNYPAAGFEQGRAVLNALARHPATAKHIATKLVRHFVADEPPAALVDRLAKVFLDTDGNLKEVAKALVTAPEAWTLTRAKLKRPGEWMAAALRATGVTPPDVRPLIQAQNTLGEPLWRPPAPKGFDDANAAWMDGLAQRLDIATQMARRIANVSDPESIVDTALGPLASAETRQAVARAESRPQALTLLLMSPEFQRR
ncbi:MAG: hypothetical protein QOJ96_1812 [Alphaproteobacteria bacterium]|jgi:uncharacterized protein (DUF1800 family)|nr:hypothetical protein [Alphaproteobacteria bacterium]